ncbi:PREDICTED: ADP-ribosylation factor-like [Nanorana parkeri]|uniref:ADP-ribosylation factor-like n=1 Tax=Nanorana parkeri TaxID=125878 RepID=UPI000854AAF3|nr:PREDICTED: ADP-ribosylation factor-like [Nanorana parkeri]
MGSLISKVKICLSAWYPVRARVLLLGLDHSGKTTTLYQLKLKEKVATISTVGFNVETLAPINGVSFTVWDVSLNTQTWPFYKHYFANTQGLIFVVDCKDGERHVDAKELLHMILGETDMEGVPFIILANKQDLQETKQPSELALELEMDKWTGHAWQIFGCSAMSGDGLQEAFHALSILIKKRGITMS